MDRGTQADPQAPGRGLWGLAQGFMGSYDNPRPFSTTPGVGRVQPRQVLQERSSRRRLDADAVFSDQEDSRSRREGSRHSEGPRRAPESGDVQVMRAEIARLQEENRRYKTQLAGQIPRSRTSLGHMEVSAQTFGVTANLTSPGDVRRMLEDLDAEIFQTAAALSEFDLRDRSSRSNPAGPRTVESEVSRLGPVLGDELVSLLSASGRSQPSPPILVQVALQAVMTTWSCTNIGAWILERNSGQLDRSLSELYAQICRTEDPKDAARWRVMARRHLMKRASAPDLGTSLLQYIGDVVILAKFGTEEHISRKTIEGAFGDRVEAVIRLVVDLNRDIGVRVVSEDLEAEFVHSGTIFDPRTMENMWPDEGGRLTASDAVVCTTGLGLRKRGQGGYPQLLTKPKVLLRSTLGQLVM
ncbi:hypothetical protein C8F04DRAFT_1047060 [Mycena alexandri]|uniref:Uncharacterized protein n=1 Tax=Mycena alexandri TaxID=1745969 RepID=A0AAD6SBI3_9AGAR|nr:hypothetical protein C8F04DRAFT_1047060 [Mycena alexandri]